MKETTMKFIKPLFLLLVLSLSSFTLMAEGFKNGVDYTTFKKPFPVNTGEKIEVREIFWYGCPHCFNLEAPLNEWRKESIPDNAEFIRMPGIFRENWVPHARAYYAFEALDQTEKLHHATMVEMHVNKKRLMSKDQIADFIATQGVDRKEFLDAYNSFSVDSLSRQAGIMTKRYGITGVPSIIVDGRYLVSTSHGGKGKLFKIVNYLVEQAAVLRKQEEK
jgi:thiol:disulfide interchange protein DsbA